MNVGDLVRFKHCNDEDAYIGIVLNMGDYDWGLDGWIPSVLCLWSKGQQLWAQIDWLEVINGGINGRE
jgi:hypothetical protein